MTQNETHVSSETPGMSAKQAGDIVTERAGPGRYVLCLGVVSPATRGQIVITQMVHKWSPFSRGEGVVAANEIVD